jgi:carbonyl reductase 1
VVGARGPAAAQIDQIPQGTAQSTASSTGQVRADLDMAMAIPRLGPGHERATELFFHALSSLDSRGIQAQQRGMARTRTALVTGANRGLERETARQLAARGLRVIAASRDGAAGERLDVSGDASVAALAKKLAAEHVTIDVLVNNAGVALKGFDAEVARRTLDVNFFGPLRVTEALSPLCPDGGNVVMVSSGMGELAGFTPRARARLSDPGLSRDGLVALMRSFVDDVAAGRHTQAGWPSSAYAVSKAGLNALVRILARELAGRRIRVNAVCPGWVRTDMGGPGASRSVEKGAASIVWAAAAEDGPTGGFFRDGKPIPW